MELFIIDYNGIVMFSLMNVSHHTVYPQDQFQKMTCWRATAPAVAQNVSSAFLPKTVSECHGEAVLFQVHHLAEL